MTPTIVLFDGNCELCQRAVRLLRRLDWLHRLQFVNSREPGSVPRTDPPLDPARLMQEMHAIAPSGRVYHGFGAFRHMAWRVPLLVLIAPFLYIPGVPFVGQRLYLWIARNRFHLVPCHDGQCQIHRPDS